MGGSEAPCSAAGDRLRAAVLVAVVIAMLRLLGIGYGAAPGGRWAPRCCGCWGSVTVLQTAVDKPSGIRVMKYLHIQARRPLRIAGGTEDRTRILMSRV
jgi:hypothetical protein